MGDLPTALALSSAILSGLHLRERTGRGCEVETSLLRNASFVSSLPPAPTPSFCRCCRRLGLGSVAVSVGRLDSARA